MGAVLTVTSCPLLKRVTGSMVSSCDARQAVFGGMKESGVGREGGLDSLNFFTEPKNVCVKL